VCIAVLCMHSFSNLTGDRGYLPLGETASSCFCSSVDHQANQHSQNLYCVKPHVQNSYTLDGGTLYNAAVERRCTQGADVKLGAGVWRVPMSGWKQKLLPALMSGWKCCGSERSFQLILHPTANWSAKGWGAEHCHWPVELSDILSLWGDCGRI